MVNYCHFDLIATLISLPLGPASCVLRPASSTVRSPRSYVLAIFAVSLFPTVLHQEVIVASRNKADLRIADFSRQGSSVVQAHAA